MNKNKFFRVEQRKTKDQLVEMLWNYLQHFKEYLKTIANLEEEVSTLTGQLGDLRVEFQEANAAIQDVEDELLRHRAAVDRNEKSLGLAKREMASIKDERAMWEKQCEELKDNMEELEHDLTLEQDEAAFAHSIRQKEFKGVSDLAQTYRERALGAEKDLEINRVELSKQITISALLRDILKEALER